MYHKMHYLNNLIVAYPVLSILISFVIGLCFMPMVIDIAKKRNFVVRPNKRTSHERTIPNIGGINIFISFLLTVFLFSYGIIDQLQFIIIGVFFILIVGFVDDLIDIKAYWKLLGAILGLIIDCIVYPFKSLKNFLKSIFIILVALYLLASLFVIADYLGDFHFFNFVPR